MRDDLWDHCLEQEHQRDNLYTKYLPTLLRAKITDRCNTKSHDFTLTTLKGKAIKAEVKSDYRANTTGNLAVEVNGNHGQPTLDASEADCWVYFVSKPHDKFDVYLFWMDHLKQLITHPDCKSRYGYEGSKLKLVPMRLVKDYLMMEDVE